MAIYYAAATNRNIVRETSPVTKALHHCIEEYKKIKCVVLA